ncbi:hypothetical protein M405DRAFT_775354, partial [Rhizopogon salebrosus TDB-379]
MWSIVSSCALTLFACICSAIHLNIPSPKDGPVRILRRRFGTMIMALIFPQLIVTQAMRQWFYARRVTTQFKASKPFKYGWTETHSFFVLMGGFMLYVNDKPYHTLSPDNLLQMAQSGCIDIPKLNISARQIRDRSKGNMISKGLVILQVAWFVLQVISRKIYHLETTQLEMGTLGFSVFIFITYAAWWNKPLDVQFPHPVYWTSPGSKPEDSYFDGGSPRFPGAALFNTMNPLAGLLGIVDNFTMEEYRVPMVNGSDWGPDGIILSLAGLVMATVFGGIHCIAWFFAFPTSQEQVLWRMSAVVITFVPWLCL